MKYPTKALGFNSQTCCLMVSDLSRERGFIVKDVKLKVSCHLRKLLKTLCAFKGSLEVQGKVWDDTSRIGLRAFASSVVLKMNTKLIIN